MSHGYKWHWHGPGQACQGCCPVTVDEEDETLAGELGRFGGVTIGGRSNPPPSPPLGAPCLPFLLVWLTEEKVPKIFSLALRAVMGVQCLEFWAFGLPPAWPSARTQPFAKGPPLLVNLPLSVPRRPPRLPHRLPLPLRNQPLTGQEVTGGRGVRPTLARRFWG